MKRTSNYQRTLKSPVEFIGVGIHSGKQALMRVLPARPGTGIVFVRTDLDGRPGIPALHRYVVNTQLATTLGIGKVTLSTVEHVLAALQGLMIDNAIIEVNGPEVPVMDGSALPFVKEFQRVGMDLQLQLRPKLVIRKKVEVKMGEKWALASPSPGLEIHASIDFDHPVIGYQEFTYVDGLTPFAELAAARTFGMLRDIENLKRMGLARGGSLENAVVLNDAFILNPEGLRSPDEFVKHKILDALGDFRLSGFSIQGKFRLHRAGHDVHCQLLQAILRDPTAFEIVGATQPTKAQEFADLISSGATSGFAASY